MRAYIRYRHHPDRTYPVDVADQDADIALAVYVAADVDPFDVIRGLDAIRQQLVDQAELPDGVLG